MSTCESLCRPPIRTPETQLQRQLRDLGAVIEQARLPAGIEEWAEPSSSTPSANACSTRWLEAAPRRGYGTTTIADVCKGAGVSRATLYELFKNKEDCFHASMEVTLADPMCRIVTVYSPDKPWATMVRDANASP